MPTPRFLHQTLRRVVKHVAGPVLEKDQEEIGLGDAFHGVTHRLGIKHCAKCQQKKQALNKRFSIR